MPTWLAGAPALGPSCAAFPRPLAGKWIDNGTVKLLGQQLVLIWDTGAKESSFTFYTPTLGPYCYSICHHNIGQRSNEGITIEAIVIPKFLDFHILG